MNPLRIVVVMIEAPVPFGNAAARWYYVLLRELVERGHRVTAFATCSKESEILEARLFPAPQYDLRLYPMPTAGGLRSKIATVQRPYSYMFSDALKKDLNRTLAEGFDVLHLEQLWCGWLVGSHADRALVNVHHLCWIDQEFLKPASLKNWIERKLLFGAERKVLRKLKQIRSCSPRLVPEIRTVNSTAEITTIPVGIDPNQYAYIDDARRQPAPILGLTGNMQWYPSSSAAIRLLTRLWPAIRNQVPEVRLEIAGWSARSVLKDHLTAPGVTIEENVPDMRPYFERMSAMLYAPGRGSGMKIKILEALGYGVPVVTTSEGVEGIPAIDGVHAGVAEDDAGLIERTVRLLRDLPAQNLQRSAGRQLLESHCGPKPTVDAIESVYAQMLKR